MNLGFKNEHVSQFNNSNKLPIVFSVNCQSGAFYSPDFLNLANGERSIAHQLLTRPNGGAVGVIGANHLSDNKFNDFLAAGLIDAMFPMSMFDFNVPGHPLFWGETSNEQYELSGIFQIGIRWMIYQINSDNDPMLSRTSGLYNREIYHCLGDPSLKVSRTKPIKKSVNHILENPDATDDPRYLVINYSDNTTYINKGATRWWNLVPNEAYSIIGNGYVPELLENYNSSNLNAQSKILSVLANTDAITVNLDCANPDIKISLYDIYGNLIDKKSGTDIVYLKPCSTIGIITMELNGSVIDSATVKGVN